MLELIGRYRIHEQIGEGAMADVYRAHDPHIDRSLAIKVLKPEYRQDREYAARFLREARAAGALSHPGIVTVFDVGEVDGYPFIVMELLEGEPLSEVLRRGAMRPSTVINIGIQLVDALAFAHGQGVIHRDIKPSNIILSPDGASLKLLDFGIAQLAEHDPLFEDAGYRTQIGQVIGTPRYMSPEQALGQKMDARSDIYSVGVVLYEMLSGKRVFPGASAATLTAQIINTDPVPLADAAPDCPRGLQFIVHKALAKQPAQRFADAPRMADALRRELSVAHTVATEAAAQRSYLPLQVRLTLLMALITALVLAGSVGTVLVKQRDAMQQVALTSGTAISAFVANNAALRAVDNAALPPAQQDWLPVEVSVKNASADPNLRSLVVADAGGVVRAATSPALIGKPYVAPQGEQLIATRDGEAISAADAGLSFRFVRPIIYAGRGFGKVDVSLNQSTLRSAAQLSTLLLVLLALVVLGTVALVTYLSARLLQAPITRLRGSLLEIAKGNLDFRISHRRRDEFGELFDDVNLVAQTAQERLSAVEALLLDKPSVPTGPPAATAAPEASLPPVETRPLIEPVTPEAPVTVTAPAQLEPTAAPQTEPAHGQAAASPVKAKLTAAKRALASEAATGMSVAPPPVTAPQADQSRPIAPSPEPDRRAAPLDRRATPPPSPFAAPEPEPIQSTPPEADQPAAAPAEPALELAPPWPRDEDEDRTLVDPDDSFHR